MPFTDINEIKLGVAQHVDEDKRNEIRCMQLTILQLQLTNHNSE